MKKIFATILLAWVGTQLYAQDIITKKNADEIKAKVVKVGSYEVEYKQWDNPDGPVYTLPIDEVFTIQYQNGQREVISTMNDSGDSVSANNRTKHPGSRQPFAPRYQGEFAVGYAFGSADRVVGELINGVRISPYFFTGLGLGFNYFYDTITIDVDDMYDYMYGYSDYDDVDKGVGMLPIFVNFKGYYPITEKAAFTFAFDLGAAVCVSGGMGTSFYTSLGPSYNVGRSNKFDVGIRYQYMGAGTHAGMVRLGIQF